MLNKLKANWFLFILLICAVHGISVIWEYYQQFPESLLYKQINITGVISSMPSQTQDTSSFYFKTKYGKVKLSWYKKFSGLTPKFIPNQKWEFTVKLKKPRGFVNPGVFNYGKFLKQQGIIASGYVYGYKPYKLIKENSGFYYIAKLRYQIRKIINQALIQQGANQLTISTVDALLLGDKSGLSYQDKKLFQQTGTSHLMAISGLHVGLIALWLFLLMRFIWSLFPYLCRKVPAQQFATIIALIGALIYSMLAGFSLPTQRAFIMLAVAAFIFLSKKKLSMKRIWLIAWVLVILWYPFSLISAGFWLSFAAVGFLLFSMGGALGKRSLIYRYFYPQLVVLAALLPLSIFWFGYFSPTVFLINIIAIPLVSFLLIPSIFIATIALLLGLNLFVIVIFFNKLLVLFLTFSKEYALMLAYHGGSSFSLLILAMLGQYLRQLGTFFQCMNPA